MYFVSAAFGDLVDDAADGMSEGGVGGEGLHGDFMDRVLSWAIGLSSQHGQVGRSIQQHLAHLVRRSADAPRVRSIVVKRMRNSRRGRGDYPPIHQQRS